MTTATVGEITVRTGDDFDMVVDLEQHEACAGMYRLAKSKHWPGWCFNFSPVSGSALWFRIAADTPKLVAAEGMDRQTASRILAPAEVIEGQSSGTMWVHGDGLEASREFFRALGMERELFVARLR